MHVHSFFLNMLVSTPGHGEQELQLWFWLWSFSTEGLGWGAEGAGSFHWRIPLCLCRCWGPALAVFCWQTCSWGWQLHRCDPQWKLRRRGPWHQWALLVGKHHALRTAELSPCGAGGRAAAKGLEGVQAMRHERKCHVALDPSLVKLAQWG